MAASLRSPRHFCLACANSIVVERLRAHGIDSALYGFCSPVCEMNYAVRLARLPRLLPISQRKLLARIQEQMLAGKKMALVKPTDGMALAGLARERLVVRHGRLGAVPTVRGDISYICARLTQSDAESYGEAQACTREDAGVLGEDHGARV